MFEKIKKYIKSMPILYYILRPFVFFFRYLIDFFRYFIIGFFYHHGIFLNQNQKKLFSFSNKYKGSTCFVIGNGPSLTPNDLNKIVNEYSFCSNKIYKIFDQTAFRPSFFSMHDSLFYKYLDDSGNTYFYEALKNIDCPIFLPYHANKSCRDIPKCKNITYLSILHNYHTSHNLIKGYWPSFTITIFLLELAIYMGFTTIYLLGVDNTMFKGTKEEHFRGHGDLNGASTEIDQIHALINYDQERAKCRAEKEYIQLAKYAKKRNISIMNATRGGELEVFPRVDFDSLFDTPVERKKNE